MNVNKVLYNIDQTGDTSSSQKETARRNIGATKVETSTSSLPPVASDVSTLTIKDNGRVIGDNGTLGVMALEPGQNDIGKVLKAQWTGSPGIGTAIWDDQWPANGAPGEALILDANGDPVWSSINEVPDNGTNGQVLTWSNNAYSWQTPATYGHAYAVYECVMTRTLDGTDTQIFVPKVLDMTDYTMNEYYTNCTAATSIVHMHRDDRSFWTATFDGSYGSMYCYSVVAVGQGSNFASELACWGYDTTMCQIVAGMNRIWYLDHSGAVVCQNGVRDTTGSLKSGSISICFTFVWSV